MANASVVISLNNVFGANGTGNDDFDFPRGITNDGAFLYIVDTQNNRIKKQQFDGTFVSEFGSFGTGNDEFSFPEDICHYGGLLYITDSANHRVKVHQTNGTYVSEFGTNGSGNFNFDYPIGIDTDGTYLFIVDKQNHRVKKHLLNGTYVSKFGFYGSTDDRFSFPEGIAYFDTNKLAIVDSGNHRVIVRRTDGVFLYKIEGFAYPTGVTVSNGILCVVGRQDNTFYFYDFAGNFIDSLAVDLYFPISATYYNGLLYITDSGNHRIKYYDLEVIFASDFYVNFIMNLTRQLYPTGRAWWMKKGGVFDQLHEGLAYSESRMQAQILGVLDSLLPDNDNFSVEDALNYERALGIYKSNGLTLAERKDVITRKIQ